MTTDLRARRRCAGGLLALPVLAMLAVPLYDRLDPALAGVPFFYWFQLAWVPLTALLLAGAARLLRTPTPGPTAGAPVPAHPTPPGGRP